MVDVLNLFNSLSLSDLFVCRDVLNDVIQKKIVNDKVNSSTKDIRDFVTEAKDFVPSGSPLYDKIQADIESFKFIGSDTPHKTSSIWLSDTDESYDWTSATTGRTFTNKAHSLSDLQGINELCGKINAEFEVELNSCLVTYYPSGTAGLRLHADNEVDMDRNSPICIVSFGADRHVDFLHKYQPTTSTPMLTLSSCDGSLYSMLPGCQEFFRHRVKADKSVNDPRISLSFRKKLSQNEINSNANVVHVTGNIPSPVKQLIQKFERPSLNSAASTASSTSTPRPNITTPPPPPQLHKKNCTVLFGTSISKHVKAENLGLRKGKKFVNLSSSGARMTRVGRTYTSITNIMDKFAYEDTRVHEVEKVLLNLATNDIRFESGGVGKHAKSAEDVVAKARTMFPGAQIIVICTLPMRNIYRYTVDNFLGINGILEGLCIKYNCTFVDCFWDFLSDDRRDINRGLYCFDGLHLNRYGIAVLTNWVSYIINNNFNNVINTLPNFYNY
jgi:alkylated DNA repair dioxygenase AlkB/lysophospholipase L1-like esterase